jgi:formylglycine-generating enzyme required for sulfatase activity
VEKVNRKEVQEFCDRLSKLLSKLTEQKYCLPTDAEWEYACRAVQFSIDKNKSDEEQKQKWNKKHNQPFYFGDNEHELDEYAWYSDNSEGQTHPVGQKEPNNFGLHDMYGNVWEMCKDHNDHNNITLKGGSFDSKLEECYSHYAKIETQEEKFKEIMGFRVILRLK